MKKDSIDERIKDVSFVIGFTKYGNELIKPKPKDPNEFPLTIMSSDFGKMYEKLQNPKDELKIIFSGISGYLSEMIKQIKEKNPVIPEVTLVNKTNDDLIKLLNELIENIRKWNE